MSALHPAFAGNDLATRADAQRLAVDLFAPLLASFSSGRARVGFAGGAASYGQAASELEGFSRPLWGIAPLLAGGGQFAYLDYFLEGLSNGSDPSHAEYWGPVGDYDQRAVEMAAIGYALSIAPEIFWDPLPGAAKDNLARWLGGIERVVVHDDNWHFFVVLVQQGLERVGVPIDQSVRDAHLDSIDSFYLGDGWYGDGPEGFVDHYNGYALHCYGLLYAGLNAARDPRRSETYVDRARLFAADFRHWFGADGASIGFGRSMTYRFGMASFWAALAATGVEALPWGEIKGLWARHVRYWLHQPMTDAFGRLTIGYRTPNLLVSEQYNSSNSPYWAMKSLLPLSAPAEHPFWRAEEASAPEDMPAVHAVPAARFLAHRQHGQAVLLPGGTSVESVRNAPDKYAKFAYSSSFGFSVESDRWLHLGFAGDNVLALSPDGRHWRVRETVLAGRIEAQRLHTTWSPWDGCRIETVQFLLGQWEIRAHQIRSDRAYESVESGFAIPAGTGDGAVSRLLDISGGLQAGVRPVMPNTNIMFPQAVVPILSGPLGVGETLFVAAVAAHRGGSVASPPPASDDIVKGLAAAGIPAVLPGTAAEDRRASTLVHA